MCEICPRLTINIPKQCHWRRSRVLIVNFRQILHFVLMFPLLTLNKQKKETFLRFCLFLTESVPKSWKQLLEDLQGHPYKKSSVWEIKCRYFFLQIQTYRLVIAVNVKGFGDKTSYNLLLKPFLCLFQVFLNFFILIFLHYMTWNEKVVHL